MKKIKRFILSNLFKDDKYNLISNSFKNAMAISFSASLILLVSVILFNYNEILLYSSLFLCLSFASIYYIASKTENIEKVITISSIYITVIILPVMWFISGGNQNGIHYVIAMIAVGEYMLNEGKTKYNLIILLIIVSLGLRFLQQEYPQFLFYTNFSLLNNIIFLIYFLASLSLIFLFINLYYIRIKTMNLELIKNNRKLNILKKESEEQKLLIQNQYEELKSYTEKLKKANKVKDKFYSIVAHDLKNPFNSLLGLSEILVNSAHKEDISNIIEYSELLQESSKKTYHLLLDMLEWTKLQSVGLEFNPEPIKLKEIIDDIFTFFEYSANTKNIKLINNIDENCNIYADINMTKTICRNLISNAIKFSKNSDIIVSAEKIGNNCSIKISDSGIGMSEDELKRIFDTQYFNKGTKGETGTGLGLGLVKEFITKHNSNLKVISQKGKGTDFIFLLPLSNK